MLAILASGEGFGLGIEQAGTYAVNAFLATVDAFLAACKTAVTSTFGMNAVTLFVLGMISFLIFLQFYDLLRELARSQRVPLEPIKKIGIILFYVAFAATYGAVYSRMATQSSTQVTKCIDYTKRSILAVNVVAVWSDALQDLREEKRDREIGNLAAKSGNEALKAADAMSKEQTGQSSDPGVLESVKKMFSAVKGAVDQVLDTLKEVKDTVEAFKALSENMGSLLAKMLANFIAFCVISVVMMLAYVAFVVGFFYKFMMLFIYFKVALTIAGLFVTPLIMLGAFQSMKHLAANAVRYSVVMMITINLMYPGVQAIFSPKNMKMCIAHSLSRNPLGSKDQEDGKLLQQTIRVDATLSKVITMPSGLANPFFWAETSVNDMLWGALSVAEMMFVMAIMAAIVLKMYELVQGTLSGSWNPVATPIRGDASPAPEPERQAPQQAPPPPPPAGEAASGKA